MNNMPNDDSDPQRDRANFRRKLSMYFKGVITFGELVGDAYELAGSQSVEDLLDEWPADLQTCLVNECSAPPQGRENWIFVMGGVVMLDTPEKRAARERWVREREDRSYRGYHRLHEHFHKPSKA